MITGNKSDIAKVLPYVSEGLQKALAYIAATDFCHIENGFVLNNFVPELLFSQIVIDFLLVHKEPPACPQKAPL